MLLLAAAGAAVLLGVGLGTRFSNPLAFLVAAAGGIGTIIVWRRPFWGFLAIVAAAAAIEPYRLDYADSVTDQIPFFRPLGQLGLGVPLTVAELAVLGLIGMMLLKRIGQRERPVHLGPLFPAVGLYTAFVVYGLFRGLSSGGDANIAVWESRAQFYPLFIYLLAYNLIESKSQLRQLLWVFLGAVALKGLVGLTRFVFVLKGDLSQTTEVSRVNSLLAHEESLFFAMFLLFGLAVWLLKADRAQLRFIAWTVPLVAFAFLANQRRAGVLTLIFGVLALAVILYATKPEIRKYIVRVALALLIVLPPYLVAFRNNQSIVGQPARSVLSIYRPDARDAGSNEARVLEDENIVKNIELSPLSGAGYGKPMKMFVQLPDLSALFSLWEYIPHNNILWVWLRLGMFGFMAFWFMIGRSLVEMTATARRATDPYIQAVALLGVGLTVAWVAQGAVDMGLTDVRVTILAAVFLGAVAKSPRLARVPAATAERPIPIAARQIAPA